MLVVVLLAMAGCPSDVTPTPEPGASIEWFDPDFDGQTPNAFTITAPARIAPPNPGDQTPEYAASTSTLAPTSGWTPNLTIQGLSPGTEYNVFARAARKQVGSVIYNEGEAVRAAQTVSTRPAGEESSIVNNWTPIPNNKPAQTTEDEAGIYSEDGTYFYIDRATPVSPNPGNQVPEYLIIATNNFSSIPTDANWQSGNNAERFRISSLRNITTQQYYIWARTRAEGTYQAGVALNKALKLPGAVITPVSWNATGSISGTTATIANNLVPEYFPEDFNHLEIDFALGTATAPGSARVTGSSTTNTLTFSGLSPGTTYYLWAMTKDTTNFREGDPIRHPTLTLTTGQSASTAAGLVDKLNAMPPAAGTAQASYVGNTIEILKNIDLNDSIDIPSGVRLKITNPGTAVKFNAGIYNITGGGSVEVDGELTVNEYNVTVPITVNTGGKLYSSAGGTYSNTDPAKIGGASDVVNLSGGAITLTMSGSGKKDYILAGTAATTSGKTLIMGPMDTFTVNTQSSFTITDQGGLELAGRLDVNPGGTLTVTPNTYNFASALKSLGARIAIHSGGLLVRNGTTVIGHTNASPAMVCDYMLDASVGSQIEISMRQKPGSNPATYETVYTLLTGKATIAPANTTTITSTEVFVVGTSLTIPIAKWLDVQGTLTVNGTLTLDGSTTAQISNLKINTSGTLNGTGNVDVNTSAVVTVSANTGKIAGSTVNVKAGAGVMDFSGEASGGTIKIADGASMTINANSVFKDSAKVEVLGTLTVPSAFNAIFQELSTNGYVRISGTGRLHGEGHVYAAPATTAVGYLGDFLLSSTGRYEITGDVLGTARTTVVSLYGGVTLRGSSTNDGTINFYNGRLVVESGATLNFATAALVPSGNTLVISDGSFLHIRGTLSAPTGATGFIKIANQGDARKTTGAQRNGILWLIITTPAATVQISNTTNTTDITGFWNQYVPNL